MNFFHAFLLGIIQGLTEFIPVSSTAHLLIAQHFLGLPADDAAFAFNVLIQLGTTAGADHVFLEGSDFAYKGFLCQPLLNAGKQIGLVYHYCDYSSLGGRCVASKTRLKACSRISSSKRRSGSFRQQSCFPGGMGGQTIRGLETMTWLDALIVGLFQVLAVFPGASRSGSTISGGMLRGFDRPAAARFAFLLSVPVSLAAGVYEMKDVIKLPDLGTFLPLLAVGFIAAAIVGWFSIRWLLNYLNKNSLYVFAAYCAIVGALCLIFLLF